LGFSIRWKNLCFFCKESTLKKLRQFSKQVKNWSRFAAALNLSAKLGAFRSQSAGKPSPPNFTEYRRKSKKNSDFFSNFAAQWPTHRRQF